MKKLESISLIGQSLVVVMQPETKYNFNFKQEDIDVNVRRLTNQLWKLIPMREHEEDWKKQLDTVIVEIAGLNEIFKGPQFL